MDSLIHRAIEAEKYIRTMGMDPSVPVLNASKLAQKAMSLMDELSFCQVQFKAMLEEHHDGNGELNLPQYEVDNLEHRIRKIDDLMADVLKE